jgi:toxin ParE1/3/4
MALVRQTLDAEADLLDIWLYIADKNRRAADKLLDSIDNSCRLIATQPEMGELRPDLDPLVRCIAVGDYLIIYRPAAGGLEVLRVVHGARDVPEVYRQGRCS